METSDDYDYENESYMFIDSDDIDKGVDKLTNIKTITFILLFLSVEMTIYETISELMLASIRHLNQYRLHHEQVLRFC